MDIILRFLLLVLIISGLLLILPGIKTTTFYCAIITAVPITIINMLITPLFEIYTVPITALCFGLIIVVLDAILLWFFGLILTWTSQNQTGFYYKIARKQVWLSSKIYECVFIKFKLLFFFTTIYLYYNYI